MVVASSSAADHMRCSPSAVVVRLAACLVRLAASEERERFVVGLLSPTGSLVEVADQVACLSQWVASDKLNCALKGADLRATFRHP